MALLNNIKANASNVILNPGTAQETDVATKIAEIEAGGSTENCMKKGVDYVTAGKAENSVLGANATAEGADVIASAEKAHAEGSQTTALGESSHAEGFRTCAVGIESHAEGHMTNASGVSSHAEGSGSKATTSSAHAEGEGTTAGGSSSHSEGGYTYAYGNYSHAGGLGTSAVAEASTAIGKYNIPSSDYAFVVGNGTSNTASNAFAVKWDGSVDISITKSQISDFPTSMTPTAHNQASNTINAMTGYSKASSAAAIAATDSLNTAIGKLEKTLDGKGTSNLTLGTTSATALAGDTKYAGASTQGGAATSANKINTDAGSTTQPVYFSNGVPIATTYSLGKSVPSNAVFTDTDTKVTVTNTNPTSITTHYPVWYTATSGTGGVGANDGFKYNTLQGTASAVGYANIDLGNATSTGTAGNKAGTLSLYSEKSGYVALRATASSTTARSIYFPDKAGTVALTSDIPSTSTFMVKGTDYVTAGQLSGSTLGTGATAEGQDVVAQGNYSHAEGYQTTAKENYSHAEGYQTSAQGGNSHAEGWKSKALYVNSHAEGMSTLANGEGAHAEGMATSAMWNSAHAEGSNTSARGNSSHAEGGGTIANNDSAHAEGSDTSAFGPSSHAEGGGTIANNDSAHAEGFLTTASNFASHAGGHRNAAMTTGGSSVNKTGTAFVIGNGTSASKLSNAFSVQYDGTTKAAGTITASTTADYAEMFEWMDENPESEDRVGYFVTNANEDPTKIRIANSSDDYILGIVSGAPFILGNGDCDVWNYMVLRDDFNRIIYEDAPLYEFDLETREEIPVLDEEGNQVYQGERPVYNPEYDHTQPYISRMDRPEWAAVGMLGVLSVYDDGTCEVNGYCTVGDNGIATKAIRYDRTANCYKVIQRLKNNIIRVIFR